MPKYNIPVRLVALGKKQVHLLKEIKNRGIPGPYVNLYADELSRFITGVSDPPKSDVILDMCDEILTEWEGEE